MRDRSATDLQAGLEAVLRRSAPECSVENLARLSGGATQEIWRFDQVQASERTSLILRRAPARAGNKFALSLSQEARLLEQVARGGVPVPAVRVILDPADGLRQGYIMDWIDGETLPTRIIRRPEFEGARARFAEQAGRLLAQLHATGVDDAGLPGRTPDQLVRELEAIYRRTGVRRAPFELALAWMEKRIPQGNRQVLVHGDFRNGNLMFGPEGIRAVLDWELAHIGDPIEDLGWMTINSWRFGQHEKPVGGIGDLAPFLAAYESESGDRVDRDALLFWQVYGTMRWGVMCASMLESVDNGEDRSPERALIARRASETEFDLLDLLLPQGPGRA